VTLDLGIAHIGLSDSDAQRLRAVMAMAFTNRDLKYRWMMTVPATANLVVVAADSEAGLAAAAASAGRQTFAVLAGEADAVPSGCLKFAWPIRLENTVSLLAAVERKIEKNGQPGAKAAQLGPARVGPANGSDLIRLASMLREGGGPAGTVWRVDGISKRPLYVAPADKAFYFNESLVVLRDSSAFAQLSFVPVPIEELSVLVGKKPLVMLQWLVGLLSGSLGLFPWIESTQAVRLTRYPDFQVLHHLPAHRKMAALLTRPRRNAQTIAAALGEEVETVIGFINAASLCGYLMVVSDAQPVGQAAPNVAKRSLFQSFRKALGIVGANA